MLSLHGAEHSHSQRRTRKTAHAGSAAGARDPARLMLDAAPALRLCICSQVVLPAEMTVAESHDIALALQHKASHRGGAIWAAGGSTGADPAELHQPALSSASLPLAPGPAARPLPPGHAVQLEALDEVERAFVHVDYQARHLPEHKVTAAQGGWPTCCRPGNAAWAHPAGPSALAATEDKHALDHARGELLSPPVLCAPSAASRRWSEPCCSGTTSRRRRGAAQPRRGAQTPCSSAGAGCHSCVTLLSIFVLLFVCCWMPSDSSSAAFEPAHLPPGPSLASTQENSMPPASASAPFALRCNV